MAAFGATTTTMNSMDGSMSASMTRFRLADAATSTRFPSGASSDADAIAVLRDALEGDDRQVPATSTMLDDQIDHGSGLPSNERMRAGARRSLRPTRSRFEPWPPARGERAEIDLVGGARAESGMRPLGVVPVDVVIELASERGSRQGHDRQEPRALVLQGTDEPLDDGEAAVLADSAETLLDAVPATPRSELVGRELRAVVGDEVGRPALDSSTRSAEEVRNLARSRFLPEVRGPHRTPRAMIDHSGHRPTERPSLRQGEWPPRDPEPTDRGNGGQVEVPHLVRAFRSHGS